MIDSIELALNSGGHIDLTWEGDTICEFTAKDLQAFYEAAKAQGAKEFMEALGEPVVWKIEGEDKNIGVYDFVSYEPTSTDIEHAWSFGRNYEALYALPNTKDEVK